MAPKSPNPQHENAASPSAPPSPEGAPVWLAQAIDWAHQRGATDLHFFPTEGEARMRVRIDGDLAEVCSYSPDIHRRILARLKVMARCADYDGDLIQEGRFSLNGTAASGEARLSVIPTIQGEKAVVRLSGGEQRSIPLSESGLFPELIDELRKAMDAPQGLLLAVGPSGCGKSTALYALLRDLIHRNKRPLSIVSIEDPVEQTLSGVAQMHIDPSRGLGFAQALRAVLRQDPEVIMIGEIRDEETAETALQAALTGHRLLSSMHTLSAAEALIRLRQMGAAPYVLTSALGGILNLRLVRLLCSECRRPVGPHAKAAQDVLGRALSTMGEVFEASGCSACLNSGHAGRTALAEWLRPTATTTRALARYDDACAIADTLQIVAGGAEHALELLDRGRCSLRELTGVRGLISLGAREGSKS